MIKKISRFLPILLSVSAATFALNAEMQKSSQSKVSPLEKGKIKNGPKVKASPGLHLQTRHGSQSPFSKSAQRSGWRGRSYSGHYSLTSERAETQYDVPTIYGCIVYNDLIDKGSDFGEVGLYEIPKSGASQPDMLFACNKASYGGVLVDNMYYSTDLFSVFGFDYVMIYGYDVTTGSNEVYIDGVVENLAPGGLTTDPTTGTVYGIFYTEDKQKLQLGSIEYNAEESTATTTTIAVLEGQWNTICCDGKGQLYGISYEGDIKDGRYVVTSSALNKLDKRTGVVTKVGDFDGYAPQYLSGALIDPKTNIMYWNYCKDDGTSYMCSINPETAEITTLYKLALNDEIMGMYFPTPEANPKAPGECESFHASFTGDSLSGNLTFTAPSALFDGTSGTGDVTVIALVNGEEVLNKNVKYGEKCVAPVSVEESGLYTFTVFASNEAGEGPRTNLKHVWVGADTPSATKVEADYADGVMKVKWNAVTSAINGGYIDLDNVTYTVTRYPGEKVVADVYKQTEFEESIPEPEDHLEVIYYVVTAKCGDLTSAPARSETITLGKIVPPYLNTFATEDDLGGWVIEDANEDDVTWFWEGVDGGDMRTSFSSDPGDDWLISPAVKLEKGKAYYVGIDARGTSTTWHERVEIKYGRSQSGEAMTNPLVGPLDLVNNEFTALGKLMVPEEDGLYYFGIHGISDADQLDLVIDNFQIEAGVSALAPGLPGEVKIVPDLYGALKAEISFTAPAVDLQGNALKSLTRVDVKRNDELVKTFENPTVGGELKFTDNLPKEGVYTYSVTGYNEEGTGLTSFASNYIGVNLPAEPLDSKLVTSIGSGLVIVDWNPVETDINGNPLLSENVSYNVYSLGMETELLASGIKDTSYTYHAVAEGEQKFVQCAVCAVTVAGEGDPGFTEMLPVGVPYESLYENFADGDVKYEFGALSIDEGEWVVLTDASFKDIKSRNGDNGFLACRSSVGAGAELLTGLVQTSGMKNPAASLYVYNVVDGEDVDDNILKIEARIGVDSEFETLLEGTVNDLCEGEEGWHRLCVSLQKYAGKVIQVKITAIGGVFVYTCIDDIRIDSMYANDLEVASFEGSDLVEWGQEVSLSATIENLGTANSGEFTVELFANGVSQDTKTVENLKAGASMNMDFSVSMPGMSKEPVVYTAVINYDKDENGDNNKSAEWSVTPVVGTMPAVGDLEAELKDDTVALTWDEPDIEGFKPAVTETFEDGTAFSSEYGSWTFVDVDNSPVGGFQNIEVPGITIGRTTGSFWIWDTAQLAGDDPTFAAHSGTHYLFSLFREDDGQVDDWAISPALSGNAQTVSFYAKSYSATYIEKVEVYYSTGSLDPKDFIKVNEAKKLLNRWSRVTADLPEGAKYFAIRSCATGGFMLMVDDVTFIPEGAKFEGSILGFDVYRDGIKINDKLVEDFTFTDSNVQKDQVYQYNVIAVYDLGMSDASNTVSVNTSGLEETNLANTIRLIEGGVEVMVIDGSNVSVSAANGIVYYMGNPDSPITVKLNPGVYLIKIGKKTYKVNVK